jgi:hypothetical protein
MSLHTQITLDLLRQQQRRTVPAPAAYLDQRRQSRAPADWALADVHDIETFLARGTAMISSWSSVPP